MESSIRRNLFFILFSVKRGNPILYFSYSLVRMIVMQHTTTLQLQGFAYFQKIWSLDLLTTKHYFNTNLIERSLIVPCRRFSEISKKNLSKIIFSQYSSYLFPKVFSFPCWEILITGFPIRRLTSGMISLFTWKISVHFPLPKK